MKRILLCGILALAAGTMAFAQWPDGFSVSGDVRTGLRADFFGGDYDKSLTDERNRSVFSFWNDDAGNRTQLDMRYTQENFGFRLLPRWVFNSGDGMVRVPVAYGWFELMNDMIKVTAGKIDDGQWVSPTPEDIHYSNGTGFRVEVKPVDGLNLGWMIGNADRAKDNLGGFDPVAGDSWRFRIRDLFAGSGFGAKYASDMFTVAAGLELRSEGAGRRTLGFGFGGRQDLMGNAGDIANGTSSFYTNYGGAVNGQTLGRDDVAVSAYAGVEVKPVNGLTVQVGANAANFDDFKTYGWMHLNEKVAYSIGNITPRVTAHQKFDLSDTNNGKFTDNFGGSKDQTPVYMEFVPGVDISNVADGLSAYVEAPIKMFDKVLEIGVKPGINYAFGPGLEIGCYYNLIVTTNDYSNGPDPFLRNTVQINLGWNF